MSRTILVIGRSGQVARALARYPGVVTVGRPDADLANPKTLAAVIARHAPAAVVNAGAYTAVDAAEAERDEAFAVNAAGAGHLARACAGADVPLVHISSDYVFDGSATRPWLEDDEIAPLSAYGTSKAEGETQVRDAGGRHVILRTSWIYSETGRNFLTTMLRLGGQRPELAIVDDQLGAPTYAADVAAAIARIVAAAETRDDIWGTYHFANAGSTTWFGFAAEIFAQSQARGRPVPKLKPITTAEYPTPARRPAYSVLDTAKFTRVFGNVPPDWREALTRCMARVAEIEKVSS
ncbi:MAG TPA: dTDP-4-dehydrorhamnose reductase [Aestuariivirgaceae bacterium]|nr:dTDP-4-dehydrorhamnose reductase [Aestuariivirgaceae bacterium]